MEIVKVKLDVIFKKIFADKENEDILHCFLADMMQIPKESITSIVLEDPGLLPDDMSGKFSRMDLRLTVNDELVNVELQVKPEPNYRDRSLYYWSRMYTSDLKSGEGYGKLKRSIALNIINFNLFDTPAYCSEFGLYEKNRRELLTDKLSICFFELRKLGKTVDAGDARQQWLQFINSESEEELGMVEKNTDRSELKKAVMIVREMSADERTREIARLREKALHDEANALGAAREEGKAAERERAIAYMRMLGISQEQIDHYRSASI